MSKWIYLFLGGGAGTVARYTISGIVYQLAGSKFPLGTLSVNLIGCFLAGFLIVLAEEKIALSYDARILIFAGFLGGFTTFSAFMIETAYLVRVGQTWTALGNVLLHVILGFFIFRLGVFLGKII